jgi:predicted outer membrane protein
MTSADVSTKENKSEISYEAEISSGVMTTKRHSRRTAEGVSGMSRQLWARGVWGIAVAVATSALAIAGAQQNNPPQNANQNPSNTQQQNNFQQGNQQQGNAQQALQQGPMGTFQRNGEPRGMAMHNDVDHYLIKVLAKANKDEIEMGKLAQQRSSNPEVKQLANQLVQDHTRFLSSLESLKHNGQPATNRQAGNQPIQQGTAFRGAAPGTIEQQQPQGQQQPSNNPNQVNPGQNNGFRNNAGQANNETMSGRRAHHDQMAGMGEHGTAGQFAKIMEEVDRNLQQSMVRELSSKQGAQFDRCFLTGQIFGHMWVVEALKVFERDASPQLKPLLQEGLQTSEQHLNHVKSLLAKLDNEPASHAVIQPRANRAIR